MFMYKYGAGRMLPFWFDRNVLLLIIIVVIIIISIIVVITSNFSVKVSAGAR